MQLNSELSGMRALHATWVRYDIQWDQIEPTPGQYNWASYDRVTQAVIAHGLRPIGIIDYSPAWARKAGCGSFACEPQNPSDYAAFAATAAAHFKGQGIHAWEIWNEPNNAQFFQPAPNPADYVSMLRAAYGAIKGVDGAATVLTGGLAPAGSPNIPDQFLSAMYAAGAAGSFDAVADHPYTFPRTATASVYDTWAQMIAMRNVMVSHRDAGKQIWITEYGAPTGGPNGVSEQLQAQSVNDWFTAAGSLPWLGPILWYSFQDSGGDPNSVESYFGLVRSDGISKKPAYYTFAARAASY